MSQRVPVTHASVMFKRLSKALSPEFPSLNIAKPGDIVGVHQYVEIKKDGTIDAWTARKYICLDSDGNPSFVNFNELPDCHQSAAAISSMHLLYNQIHHAGEAYAVFDHFKKHDTDARNGFVCSMTMFKGAIYVQNTRMENSTWVDSSLKHEDPNSIMMKNARVILREAETSHQCVRLTSIYNEKYSKTLKRSINLTNSVMAKCEVPDLAFAMQEYHASKFI